MVTIYDVAKEAGVSHTTVSRVLNKKKTAVSISEETKKKVLEAAGRLNYVPNWAAINLRTGSSDCYCFLLCDRQFSNLYYYHLLKSVEEELSKRGKGLIFVIYKENEDLPPMVREKAIDGIFVAGRVTQEIVEKVKKTNIPFVVLGKMADKECNVNRIRADIQREIFNAYEYLLERGHREIAYVSDYKENLLIQEVTMGCKLAYEKRNIEPRTNLLKVNVKDPYKTITDLLKVHQEITAFIVQAVFAGPFLYLIRENKLDIPDKISVIMCNDELLDEFQLKNFTSLSGGIKEMGKEGVRSLMELREGLIEKINITFTSRIKEGETVKTIL